MEYLLNFLKNNAKFEALEENKTILEHFIGKVVSFEDTIKTTRILSENREFKPQKGSVVELIIHTPKGVYAIECETLNELEDGFEFSYPTTARLSQRREFLRVDINAPLEVQIINGNNKSKINTTTENVCAGGVAFVSDFKIDDETNLELDFEIEGRKFNSKGKIAYSLPVSNNKFRNGVIMTSLKSDESLFIIDFCTNYIGQA